MEITFDKKVIKCIIRRTSHAILNTVVSTRGLTEFIHKMGYVRLLTKIRNI